MIRRLGRAARRHRAVTSALAAVAVAVVVVVLTLFQPQRLLYSTTVDEPPPAPVSAASPTAAPPVSAPARVRVLRTAMLHSRGHPGSGTVRVLDVGGGRLVVRLEDLRVTNGPDLHVYLTAASADAPNGAYRHGFRSLGQLKGNRGNQNYAVPAGTDLAQYRALVIWCKRFAYAFAAAPLE